MYVLGMAKSMADPNGAKAVVLRRDASELARAVAMLRAHRRSAVGYLLVLTETVARRASGWDMFSQDSGVNLLLASLPESEFAALVDEKLRNRRGITSGIPSDSIAALGRQLAERELISEIERRHPQVQRCDEPMPLGVDWDYFGIAPDD